MTFTINVTYHDGDSFNSYTEHETLDYNWQDEQVVIKNMIAIKEHYLPPAVMGFHYIIIIETSPDGAVYDNIIKINESLIVSLKYGFNPNNGKYESILKPDNAVVNHLTDIIMEAHAEIKKINPKHRIPSRSRYTGSKVRIWIILVIIAVIFLMIKSCS